MSDLSSPQQNKIKPFPMKIEKEEITSSTSVPILSHIGKKDMNYDAYDYQANLTENINPQFNEIQD